MGWVVSKHNILQEQKQSCTRQLQKFSEPKIGLLDGLMCTQREKQFLVHERTTNNSCLHQINHLPASNVKWSIPKSTQTKPANNSIVLVSKLTTDVKQKKILLNSRITKGRSHSFLLFHYSFFIFNKSNSSSNRGQSEKINKKIRALSPV